MYRKYKKELILSSVATLLPIVIGLLLWDKLPDVMATHWGADNQPDGYSSKAFALFFMPCFLLGFQVLMPLITKLDPKMQQQNKKAFGIIFWIFPAISIISSSVMYGVALDYSFSPGSLIFLPMGLLFMGLGNYLPKTTLNYQLGIKVIWTVTNEENWNATHRFAGKIWFFGGLILMLTCFLPAEYSFYVLVPVMIAMVLVPTLYSYLYYKKQCKEGRGYSLNIPSMDQKNKTVYRISMVFLVIILAAIFFIMFTGDISCEFDNNSFTVTASFHDDLTVEYCVIDDIEIRYEPIPGRRDFGFGSARLLLGTFSNEEFGIHSRYTYTNCDCAVIVTAGEKVLVLATQTQEETEEIYRTLLEKTGLGG